MKRGAPVKDINENTLVITKPKKAAAGLEAVVVALDRGIAQAGVTRTARPLLRLNQRNGTNNRPDCSNMCHESSGSALNPTIGIGKGTASLRDIHQAELILVVGQNPGTNHPRMLSALKECKDNGGKIVAVNPLPEAGLFNFKDPQTPSGLLGDGTAALEAAMQRVGLTVHLSTKPNRSHVMHGKTSLILPTLGRTDTDDKHPKGRQVLSVEDSMSVVHDPRTPEAGLRAPARRARHHRADGQCPDASRTRRPRIQYTGLQGDGRAICGTCAGGNRTDGLTNWTSQRAFST